MTSTEQSRAHRLRLMSGRDPYEQHRAATPLELLYDLTFVVAFGVAGEQFAHLLAEGHFAAGLAGFVSAVFAVCWCWINYSWFASACDTDDWAFLVATMVQMVGVIVLALGLPRVFHSIDEGTTIDNTATVAGYVVMRVPMIFLWLWWMYFTVPVAEVLEVHRERWFLWGYGHMLIFGSIAATGAGLHVAALYIGHEVHIGATATVMTVAVPVAVFVFALFALYTYLVQAGDPFHIALLAGTAAVLALAVLLASAGLPMAVCLLVLMLAPLVSVIGYETVGHRHLDAALNRALAA
jgi:low temperature requirement protein LtrA